MMRKVLVPASMLIVAIFIIPRVEAHHSFSMFDRTREEVVVGQVVRWGFNSPHVLLYVEDADGTQWGFEGAAPAAILGRDPSMNGFTLRPGDPITMVHCPLGDGRAGGAIGLIISGDGTVYNPSDGGCGASQRTEDWPEWIEMGFTSRAEAEEALGIDSDEQEPD